MLRVDIDEIRTIIKIVSRVNMENHGEMYYGCYFRVKTSMALVVSCGTLELGMKLQYKVTRLIECMYS